MKSIKTILLFIALMTTAVSCSKADFGGGNVGRGLASATAKQPSPGPAPGPSPSPTPVGSPPDPSPPPSAPLTNPLVSQSAVFAVRNVSCTLCHANVNSSIITDFGVGTGATSAEQIYRDFFLNVVTGDVNDANVPATPTINGNIYVPSGTTKLATILTTNGQANCQIPGKTYPTANTNWTKYIRDWTQTAFSDVSILDNLNNCAAPQIHWGSGNGFVAKSSISINPLSNPSDVRSLASDQNALATSGSSPASSGGNLSGITGSKSGFVASSSVSCEGAFVFDAPILLANTTITTQTGCRLYSTASILVFGNLSVTGPSANANVQLLSSLYVGFDVALTNADNYSVTGRLLHAYLSNQQFSSGSSTQLLANITKDFKSLNALSFTGSGTQSYSRVAAAAPVVYSRNSGSFSGIIIAEQFLGHISSLSYSFDAVFKNPSVMLFPEVKTQMVVVQ